MKISSISDLENITNDIKKKILPGDYIFLYGEIGVGKTTFVRSLINSFEKFKKVSQSEVLSPTFNIVYSYSIKDIKIMHYDFYRIRQSSEIEELNIFNDEDTSITIVEWPRLLKIKPKNRIEIRFRYLKNFKGREVYIKGFGSWKKYEFNKL